MRREHAVMKRAYFAILSDSNSIPTWIQLYNLFPLVLHCILSSL